MKPSETKSFNNFILSFLAEDAASTIAPQGKATPKAGSVDAVEKDDVNAVITAAIEAGKMFEDDSKSDEEEKEVVKEEGEKEDEKEAVKEASEEEDKKAAEEMKSEAEEKEDEKEVVKEEDEKEDEKEVKSESEDEDFVFTQADLDDLESELGDEDEIKEGEQLDVAGDPWPMRRGAVAEAEEKEDEKEVVKEEEKEDDEKEVKTEAEEKDDDEKEVVKEAEGDKKDDEEVKAESEEEELKKDSEKSESEDEEEVELPKLESEDDEEEKLKVESDLNAILNGNEKLNEGEIKEKAKAIFEAAVKHRVNRYVNKLNKIFRASVVKEAKATTSKWKDSVDKYLDHVVTEWKKENAAPLQKALSNELTESIALDITRVLKKRGIVIPESKVDLVKKTLAEKEELQKKLDESIKAQVSLKENNQKAMSYLRQLVKKQALDKAVEGLNEAQKAKILPVLRELPFKDEKDFLGRAKVIRESYVTKPTNKTETLMESQLNKKLSNEPEKNVDPVVADCMAHMGRTVK